MGYSIQAMWTLGIGFIFFLPGLCDAHCHCYSWLRYKEEGTVVSFRWEDCGVRWDVTLPSSLSHRAEILAHGTRSLPTCSSKQRTGGGAPRVCNVRPGPLTLLLPAFLWFFWAMPHSMRDLSSPARGRTCHPALEEHSLNHWTAREVCCFPRLGGTQSGHFIACCKIHMHGLLPDKSVKGIIFSPILKIRKPRLTEASHTAKVVWTRHPQILRPCSFYTVATLILTVLVAQLFSPLCDPLYCSLPGSSVHRVFQARILEWVAISFSKGSSWTRDRIQVSWISGRFIVWVTREALILTEGSANSDTTWNPGCLHVVSSWPCTCR